MKRHRDTGNPEQHQEHKDRERGFGRASRNLRRNPNEKNRWFDGGQPEDAEHRRRMKELSLQFRPPKKWVVLTTIGIQVTIAASWGLAYALMGFIYNTWFPEYGHDLLRQYLTVVLGLFILFYTTLLVRRFFAPVRRSMDWILQLLDAMKKLSKGDFNVNLETNTRFMGQFGPLVTGFNEMATELSQMEQMRQEFVSNVSHEIQSPLTSITGFAKALQNDKLSPETRKHYLEIIETESKRLSRMSDNLLKLTSLESKHHPFEVKPYRLDRQIRHIILSCEPLWQEKNIEMDVELPELIIHADEDLLSQVWVNLLHNSIKFTPEGGTISVELVRNADLIRIVITDSGDGVSDEALPHLFERFYKEDKARERSGSGSGLGLSIVKKIVNMHGGEVSASNHVRLGAVLTVVLPILH
ncbi:cell wall metabolism sensor histidine kinase WalK [Cohnella sp. WQ 127256]|uniref:sensor histidine kinase n=1 Tax=Cohnella sp. WQ 127256 TaxID=2938790 RepID=UPI002117E8E8|nr:HAMP domain-containing sensor histidine kinase [Cohnella sp. WQ 127256]